MTITRLAVIGLMVMFLSFAFRIIYALINYFDPTPISYPEFQAQFLFNLVCVFLSMELTKEN